MRRLLENGGEVLESFIKTDFMDSETSDGFKDFQQKADGYPSTLTNAVKKYRGVILAATVVDPNKKDIFQKVEKTYVALYAEMRGWGNKDKRYKFLKSLPDDKPNEEKIKQEITGLLESRRYVVLQGAPGTGKTRMAKMIANPDGVNDANKYIYFTQFHAETSYSDFVYGIRPDVKSNDLRYVAHEGEFVKAVKAAQAHPDQHVYLIIDEINRANLSNVLGPAFYLFEPSMDGSGIEIELCPESSEGKKDGFSLEKLPDNLYVIATMNTADRSLAVVDFALRRRFAWYTMYPHSIEPNGERTFCEDEFNKISDIFVRYATDEELTLQPGQSYFIVNAGTEKEKKAQISLRLKYELMPLIKEYLDDGMLARAKDAFVEFFRESIGEEMYA